MNLPTVLLIVHALVGVALLGAVTHQLVSVLRRPVRIDSFVDRYSAVDNRVFTGAVAALYVLGLLLGAIIYPKYRVDVRIPFEEMRLGWAIGLFELKEHFAGIGLGVLPFYLSIWRPEQLQEFRRARLWMTAILAFIVWWDFLVGHVLNNLRGLA